MTFDLSVESDISLFHIFYLYLFLKGFILIVLTTLTKKYILVC